MAYHLAYLLLTMNGFTAVLKAMSIAGGLYCALHEV
jgi:hypothetical protein